MEDRLRRPHQRAQAASRAHSLSLPGRPGNEALGGPRRHQRQPHQHRSRPVGPNLRDLKAHPTGCPLRPSRFVRRSVVSSEVISDGESLRNTITARSMFDSLERCAIYLDGTYSQLTQPWRGASVFVAPRRSPRMVYSRSAIVTHARNTICRRARRRQAPARCVFFS